MATRTNDTTLLQLTRSNNAAVRRMALALYEMPDEHAVPEVKLVSSFNCVSCGTSIPGYNGAHCTPCQRLGR